LTVYCLWPELRQVDWTTVALLCAASRQYFGSSGGLVLANCGYMHLIGGIDDYLHLDIAYMQIIAAASLICDNECMKS
jgi:hypothetical protein